MVLSSPFRILQTVPSEDPVGLKYESQHNDSVRKLARFVGYLSSVKLLVGSGSLRNQVQ